MVAKMYSTRTTKRNLVNETLLRNSNFLKAGYLILLTIRKARIYTMATINPGLTLYPNKFSNAMIVDARTAAAAGVANPIKH